MKNVTINLLVLLMLGFTACVDSVEMSDPGVLVPLTVMEDSSLPSITIDGIKLHSEAFGDPTDPMVLVLHGGPGADYRSQLNYMELVSDGFYVVFYDQRGSGLSQRVDAETYSEVKVFVDELDGVIKHYRQDMNQKVVLAGHSWGAMLATAYINEHPTLIDGVILAEPGGFTWEQTEAYISRSRKLELFAEATNDFVYQDQLITGSDHNTLDYKMALSLSSDVSTGDVSPPSYWRYGFVCNNASINLAINNPDQMNFTENLDNFEPKILFAYSELNPSYGVEHATLLSTSLKNVELVEVQGCGHEIPEFGWNNYYPIVKKYLQEIM